ncbi:MAG TPA: hypothetical protein VFB28_03590 [Terriglobales bacterium]|nr:hypothetical protein [Terriglobales bacterium]
MAHVALSLGTMTSWNEPASRHGTQISMLISNCVRGRKEVHRVALLQLLCFAASLIGCGGASPAPIDGANAFGPVSVSIAPASIVVPTGSTQVFTATVNNSGLNTVQWLVNGFPGGGGNVGTIDSKGNYTAPQFIPTPATVTISAISNADNTKSGAAQVTVTGAQVPPQIAMSPTGTAYLQVGKTLNLAASVVGPIDTAIIWQIVQNGTAIDNGNAIVGTIAPTGNGSNAVYTAPAKLPTGSLSIRAAAHAQPNIFVSCALILSTQPPDIATVTISPVLTTVEAGTFSNFTGSVAGVTDTSISWQVNAKIDGSTEYGTIAGTGSTGNYTAPAKPPVPNMVTVAAVSHAQPNRTGLATVTVAPPPANPLTIQLSGASSLEVCNQSDYTATIGNATNDSVTWQVNGVTGGNATYGTIAPDAGSSEFATYSAPTVLPFPSTVVISAIPNAAPTQAASLDLTLTNPVITVKVIDSQTNQSAIPIGINQTAPFQGTVSTPCGAQTATWYVGQNGTFVEGGNATLGTISPDVLANDVIYTAPATVPTSPTVTIKATADAAPSIFGTATVTINPFPVYEVIISPSTPQTVQVDNGNGISSIPYSAIVVGTTDTALNWEVNGEIGGDSSIGTITPNGGDPTQATYLAPMTIPSNPKVNITAVSVPFPTVVSNTDQVTIVNNGPPPPSVTIEALYPLIPGQAEPVTADVQNAGSNTTVNWTLSLPGGGLCNSTVCGTILPAQTNNVPTTYTAPQSIPTDPYYVNITATLAAYPNVHNTATMEITSTATASVSITPTDPTIQAGSAQNITFNATVINAPAGTDVTWQLGCNSLAPQPNEWCFDFSGDGGGPGCLDVTSKECFTNTQSAPPSTPAIYDPPGTLGGNFQLNACTSTQTANGMVPLTVTISAGNCTATSCTAQACITITPP